MKLYFAPGACSLAPHIVLREGDIACDLEQVDLRAKQTKSGGDYRAINPKGSVPVLGLDSGETLTEAAVILQYLADQKPAAKLAPAAGTPERYRLQEWLNWTATEIHKGISPFFNPNSGDGWKAVLREKLALHFDYAAKRMGSKPYLMGDNFSVADAYFFTVLRWTKLHNIDTSKWPAIGAFMDRVAARAGTQAAMQEEGLLK